jgi:UDP-glucose 4-epimerase
LIERGARVRVLDDFSTGRRENLAAVADQIELIEGDVSDPDVARRAVDDCEYIVHLAAVASVQASVEDPGRTRRVNVDGTLNMLEAARQNGVRRVILASTTALYGDHTALPLQEDLPLRPLSPYAASKATGEAYLCAYLVTFGLPTVALRFFNVYGPRQDPSNPYSGVISLFVARMSQGQRPIIYGDGKQTRDFVYVGDVVRAILLASEREEAIGNVFNVASDSQTSILQLAEALNRVLGTDLEPTFAPARAGEVRFSQGDVRRAREVLGWQTEVSLQEGLARLVQEA